jgi:hypothetical protein
MQHRTAQRGPTTRRGDPSHKARWQRRVETSMGQTVRAVERATQKKGSVSMVGVSDSMHPV